MFHVNLIHIIYSACTLNPPPILINPLDKSMFLVGDIITCTTESILCKSGLTYILYAQRDLEPVEEKHLNSLTLSKKHIGNNIKVTCATGEGETSKDQRLIRVEIAPHNVTISKVYHMMVYRRYLRCNAIGFPSPTISWTQIKGPSILTISEYFLLIGPLDFSGDYSVQCEAKNERGSVSTSASFKVFNPRIVYTDYSSQFYFFIPFLTLLYIIFTALSLLLIFQENFFAVPFFSRGTVEVTQKEKPRVASIAQKKLSDEDEKLS